MPSAATTFVIPDEPVGEIRNPLVPPAKRKHGLDQDEPEFHKSGAADRPDDRFGPII
jgi:hypothetical protein